MYGVYGTYLLILIEIDKSTDSTLYLNVSKYIKARANCQALFKQSFPQPQIYCLVPFSNLPATEYLLSLFLLIYLDFNGGQF